jgi:hypothetical protein
VTVANDDEDTDVRFGGFGLNDLVDAPGPFQRAPQPRWWVPFEQAFFELTSTPEGRAQYGDPTKGATLEQAWRARTLLDDEPVCLVSKQFPNAKTGAIPEAVRLAPRELIGKIAEIVARPRNAVQLFLYDGQTGHCVVVHRALRERNGFEYHDPWPKGNDPWPEGTFLAAGRNQAGVEAQPLGSRWFVKETDLETVAYAAFVSPGPWKLANGSDYRIAMSELKASDFCAAFALTETDQSVSTDGLTRVTLQPGSFQDSVGIGLELDDGEHIRVARLTLRRGWMTGPPWGINPLATNIASRYVPALTPEQDRPRAMPVAELYASIADQDAVKARIASDPELGPFAVAFLGQYPSATRRLALSTITASNEEWENDSWFVVSVESD